MFPGCHRDDSDKTTAMQPFFDLVYAVSREIFATNSGRISVDDDLVGLDGSHASASIFHEDGFKFSCEEKVGNLCIYDVANNTSLLYRILHTRENLDDKTFKSKQSYLRQASRSLPLRQGARQLAFRLLLKAHRMKAADILARTQLGALVHAFVHIFCRFFLVCAAISCMLDLIRTYVIVTGACR